MFAKINLKKKQKILCIAAAALVGIFLAERLFFFGMRTKIKNIRQQVKLAEKVLERDLALQQSKDRLVSEYNKYQVYIMPRNFSPDQLVAQFLNEIEKLAKDSAVSVVNLSPQPSPEGAKGNGRIKADLRLEATYNQVLSFMQKVQESRLLIALDRISFTPKDEQASLLRCEIVVSMALP